MSDQETTEATPSPESEQPDVPPGPDPETADDSGRLAEPAPEPARARRLVRSREDRVLAGVCGGLGDYLGVDAVLIRIAALVLLFAGGAGALLYAIGWIAMPEAPEPGTPEAAAHRVQQERTSGAVALGVLFVALGAFFLVDEIWSDFLAWKYVWPIVLIVVGATVLVRARR